MNNDWRSELGKIMGGKSKATRAEEETARFVKFSNDVVMPAFKELETELKRHDRKVLVRETTAATSITVMNGEKEEITFRLLARSLSTGLVPYIEGRVRSKGQVSNKFDEQLKVDGKVCTIEQVKANDVIESFLGQYGKTMEMG